MAERRQNGDVRSHAEQWYEALRTHLGADGARSDITERLKSWATLNDVMATAPRLVPHVLMMAWQLRAQPAMAGLFQTSSGKLADDRGTPLSPGGKSFDDTVLAHLHGALRVYCGLRERQWLAAERERHKPTGLATIKVLKPLMQRIRRERDEDLLERYPHYRLYPALKSFLRHQRQFELIEAFAELPTRMVPLLGNTISGLTRDPSIRSIAALESAKCKLVVELARLFADTVIKHADAARAAGAPPPAIEPPAVRDNLGLIAGTALDHLTVNGLHLAKAIVNVRDIARDVTIKLAAPMGYAFWNVFADPDAALNVGHAPMPLANVLGVDTVRVHRKTSDALKSIKTPRLIEDVIGALVQIGGRESLLTWAASESCAELWGRIQAELNQHIEEGKDGALTPSAILAYCQTLAPTFTALSAPNPTTST